MILSDLHVHSRYSDGRLTIAELVDLYGQRGFGCIAITDHICENNTFLGLAARYMNYTLTPKTFSNYMSEIEREGRRARKKYGMTVLPGFELSKNSLLSHRSAHILGIGISEYVHPEASIIDLAQSIRAQGALAVAAHPVPTGRTELQTLHLWDQRDRLAEYFDAWEVASGPDLFEPVLRSGLPMIATSDLHHPRQIHSWKTVIHSSHEPQAILDAIRRQEVEFRFYAEPETQNVPAFAFQRTLPMAAMG